MKKYIVLLILILIFLTTGFVSADDNISENITSTVDMPDNISDSSPKLDTKIETNKVTAYYKDNCRLISYLKDSDNRPVSGKNVSITIDDKNYNKITDNSGKIILKLDLKPGNYVAQIKFAGDENFTPSGLNTTVKVNKAALKISTHNFKTYFESGFYFKAKITNRITKNPAGGIKVVFKVYKNNKCKTYFATTDKNGIAKLKKNLNPGSYKIITSLRENKFVKFKKSKSTLTVKKTAEMGCSSLYVQVSNTEAVGGFRRDATNAKTLHIVKYKLAGKSAVKQYKTGSYFFHLITTSDGWMIATGGWDNPKVNHAIEKLAGVIVKKAKITGRILSRIQTLERKLPTGHFSVKSPDGKYGLVWANAIYTGKLKPGEYIKVPNARSLFKHGKWIKLSKNPKNAAVKIAATDSFGVNRRDVTVFHWKAVTSGGKTTSNIKVYAADDDGRLAGKNTAHLKDDIIFKAKLISKNKLPKTPYSKFLGTYNMGNIDRLIKTQTVVKAPGLTKAFNESKMFNIAVKNKKTNKPVKNLNLRLKIANNVFTLKTDSGGTAVFNLKHLGIGNYAVHIYTNNIRYKVSFKSTIKIT